MMIAVLLAGGSGKRFATEEPKQFSQLNGKSLLEYSLDVICSIEIFDRVILVINKKYENKYIGILRKYHQIIHSVEGGHTRQLSVYNALLYIENNIKPEDDSHVLIHDSARPFSGGVFKNVIDKLKESNAVIPVVPMVDTIYRCDGDVVKEIPSRNQFVKVQTPQGFDFYKILDCHKKAYAKNDVLYSDDGSLYMNYSNDTLTIAEGDQENFKITKAVDLDIARFILRNNQV